MDSQMLTTLMACPLLFDRTFNQDLISVQGKAPALETGSLVHTIAEFYGKALINGANRNNAIDIGFEAGKEYCKPFNELNKYIKDTEHAGIVNVPKESDDGRIVSIKDVFDTMIQYFDYWKNDTNTILEVEVVKKRIIYEDSDIKILWNGKMDAVIDTPMSIMAKDIKTMKQKRDTVSMNNQFIGYCHLVGSRFVMIDKIGFQKTLKPAERFIKQPIPYSLARLEEWRTETLPFWANMYVAFMEAKNFPMNLTHCENKYGRCRFYDVCETDANIREEVMMTQFKKGKKWDVKNED